MSYIISKTIDEVVSDYINCNTFLPAIQREFIWNTSDIEKLFDSIMCDFPIGTLLFWKIRNEAKEDWVSYKFISDFDKDDPHNETTDFRGNSKDINLVLDGQQRLTALYIGLKGSYSFSYYKKRHTKLYLNLLKPIVEFDKPDELTYEFKFRESSDIDSNSDKPQYWYLVGNILNYIDAEDAKEALSNELTNFSKEQQDSAKKIIGKLHSRIKTYRSLHYYEETTNNYDKAVETFIRTNTGGKKLEYSDILLSTATAKWTKLNAREEIANFTDSINKIGNGYSFGKDFVLKGALYLTDDLPIQYKVSNFTRENLKKIEGNWDVIKKSLEDTIQLIYRFGFNDKNLISRSALLPIAYFIKIYNKKNFINSTDKSDIKIQLEIQKWIIVSLLKNVFKSSTDAVLKSIQDIIKKDSKNFQCSKILQHLGYSLSFTDFEIERYLSLEYKSKYSFLILSLLYPDRDWKDKTFHEDHIFPKSEIKKNKLENRGYSEDKIDFYLKNYNIIPNLQLLTDSENLEKNKQDFGVWLKERDSNFKNRHTIPIIDDYCFDNFETFIKQRKEMISKKLLEYTI